MTLAPGIRLGPYDLVGQIGAGGMGEVWKARDPKLDRFVAIKVLPPGFAEDPERLRRFEQEARVLASLAHPNIVQVYDAGEHEGHPYLVMELVAGETLRQRLDRGRLSWRMAVELAAAIADGLAAAHAKGIVHRDLKPENLVFSEHGHVKILDFGLAKLWPGPAAADSRVDTTPAGTLDGALLGTVGYMAPEQVQGLPADARSDLFALGCVLYELVTGRRAFARNSTVETLAAILKDPVPEPSLSGSGGTPELDRILGHCLEKLPGDRFQTAKDLAFDLRTLLASAPAATSGASQPPASERLRPRWLLPAAGLLILAAATSGILLWAPWKPAVPPWDARTVAILPFENRTGDPSLDGLGHQVVDLIRQDLQQVDNLKVATDTVLSGGGDPVRKMAETTKARLVASGAYYLKGGEVELQARLVDPWSGKAVYTLGPWRGPKGDPAKALAELRQGLGGAVAWSYDEFFRFEPGAMRAPRLDALLAFRKELKSFGRDYAANIAGCEQALALDPEFFMARHCLHSALWNQGKWVEALPHFTRMEADYARFTPLERAFVRWWRAVREGLNLEALKARMDMEAIQPDVYFLRVDRAGAELALNRTGHAISSLKGIPPNWLGEGMFMDYWPANALGAALHQAGDYAGELAAAREAQAQFPDVLEFRAYEVAALVALGRLQELEPVFQVAPTVARRPQTMYPSGVLFTAVQELRAHGHREESRRLAARLLADLQSRPPEVQKAVRGAVATMLIYLDRNAEALEIFHALVTEDPKSVDYQGYLGGLLARLGRKEEARKVEADLAALTRPYLHGWRTYARARIVAQLGEKDRAVSLLGQAFGQGYPYHLGIHCDIDLEPLRGFPPYEALMKPKD